MNINLMNITIKELIKGYLDSGDEGVVAYGGKLNVRPPYQREFIYGPKDTEEVIRTVNNGFPLNVMYWNLINDGEYEIIDGQQRTISLCKYASGDFSFENQYFHNLTDEEKKKFENYELYIYVCEGTDKERLDWFRVINIAGKKLNDQERRNAVYSGSWITDARRYFSKRGGPAYEIGRKYLNGVPERQDYLQTVIKWISKNEIEDCMAQNQHKQSSNDLWLYFNMIITWIEATFINYRENMKGVDWGTLFDEHGKDKLDPSKLECEISKLSKDSDVENKRGIYSYVLNGDERFLEIRAFDENDRVEAYEKQKGICPNCKEKFKMQEMEADHIKPWSKGGRTIPENLQMLCQKDNKVAGNK